MRSMWKGAIQFGLVSVPIRLYLAVDPAVSRFHLLHQPCSSRIQTKTWCPTHDAAAPRSELVRAVEVAPDRYVAFSDDELAGLPVRTLHTIDVDHVVPASDASRLVRFARGAYFVAPEDVGRRPYALLRSVLADAGLAIVAKLTIREREHPVLIEPLGKVLVLNTLAWPSEVRAVDELDLPDGSDVKPAERALADQLVAAMTASFDPGSHRDAYADALDRLIESKIAGSVVVQPDVEPSAQWVDLMAALQQSLDDARRSGAARAAGGKGASRRRSAAGPAATRRRATKAA